MLRIDLQLPIEVRSKKGLLRRSAGIVDLLQDPAVIAVALVAVLVLVFGLFLDHRAATRQAALAQSVQSAVRDSARFERDLKTADELRARRGRIVDQIEAVESVDRNRFAFVHVLDQAASALIADVWLESVESIGTEARTGNVRFNLSGFAPGTEEVDRYIKQLESSPFVAGVALQGAQGVEMNNQQVTRFVVTARSEVPDVSFLLTETIRPDGTVVSDLDSDGLLVTDPAPAADSVTAPDSVAPDSATGSRNPALPGGGSRNPALPGARPNRSSNSGPATPPSGGGGR